MGDEEAADYRLFSTAVKDHKIIERFPLESLQAQRAPEDVPQIMQSFMMVLGQIKSGRVN